VVDASLPFSFAKTGTAQFADWCIAGSVTQATRCLVLQSLLQAPVSLYLDTSSKLPPHSIHLFLHIAFMLMTTGQMQHDALSSILVLVFSLISPDYKEWPSMPSSTAGFQSHILNPTNQHSLVSILPIPSVYMLHDQSHVYCCLREIAAYVLLLPRSTGAPPIPLRLTQLCQSAMMKFVTLPVGDLRDDVPSREIRNNKGLNYYYQGKTDVCVLGGLANAVFLVVWLDPARERLW
jgi:hypothetical protein